MSVRLIKAMEEVRALPYITFGKIIDLIEEESLVILCLIAILPFMQPIPIPGLSSILGLVVLFQGIGLMFWSKPLLTMRLKNVHISHEKFEYIYKAAIKLSRFASKISAFKHPITNSRFSHFICGFAIVLSSGFLSLPLPIPFSNFIPALSIFLICIGLLEDDVVLLIIGHGINIAVMMMAVFSFHIIKENFQSYF
jgi:hypothetical protein